MRSWYAWLPASSQHSLVDFSGVAKQSPPCPHGAPCGSVSRRSLQRGSSFSPWGMPPKPRWKQHGSSSASRPSPGSTAPTESPAKAPVHTAIKAAVLPRAQPPPVPPPAPQPAVARTVLAAAPGAPPPQEPRAGLPSEGNGAAAADASPRSPGLLQNPPGETHGTQGGTDTGSNSGPGGDSPRTARKKAMASRFASIGRLSQADEKEEQASSSGPDSCPTATAAAVAATPSAVSAPAERQEHKMQRARASAQARIDAETPALDDEEPLFATIATGAAVSTTHDKKCVEMTTTPEHSWETAFSSFSEKLSPKRTVAVQSSEVAKALPEVETGADAQNDVDTTARQRGTEVRTPMQIQALDAVATTAHKQQQVREATAQNKTKTHRRRDIGGGSTRLGNKNSHCRSNNGGGGQPVLASIGAAAMGIGNDSHHNTSGGDAAAAKMWSEMAVAQQEAAQLLGWSETSWDNEDQTPYDMRDWAEMSVELQTAAVQVLGQEASKFVRRISDAAYVPTLQQQQQHEEHIAGVATETEAKVSVLPAGWDTCTDPVSGNEYYFHAATNHSRWASEGIPPASAPEQNNSEPEPKPSCNKFWAEMTNDEVAACQHLGWTEASWDNPPEGVHPAPLNREWETLTNTERHCAAVLKFDKVDFRVVMDGVSADAATPTSNEDEGNRDDQLVALLSAASRTMSRQHRTTSLASTNATADGVANELLLSDEERIMDDGAFGDFLRSSAAVQAEISLEKQEGQEFGIEQTQLPPSTPPRNRQKNQGWSGGGVSC